MAIQRFAFQQCDSMFSLRYIIKRHRLPEWLPTHYRKAASTKPFQSYPSSSDSSSDEDVLDELQVDDAMVLMLS